MNDTMELAVVDAQNAVQIFTGGGLDAVLDGIEAKVRAIPLDPSTATGREEIRSVAYKVIRTKTTLDAEGKKLTEGWREATKKVNDERKRSLERLDALAEEIRKPLTDFENKERDRVAAHEAALVDYSSMRDHLSASPDLTVDQLKIYEADISAAHPGRNWEEFSTRAGSIRGELLATISKRIQSREKQDREQAELARLRAEEAERIQRERDERLKAEAAEKARLEAERKAKEAADAEAKRVIEAAEAERKRVNEEADRVRRENEQASREAAESLQREEQAKLAAERRAKDAEAARIAAEAKADKDRIEAAECAAKQLKEAEQQARRDADAAAQRERDRISREQKDAEDARVKREANAKLRAKIRAEIVEDLTEKSANEIADALMAGRVRHVKVVF